MRGIRLATYFAVVSLSAAACGSTEGDTPTGGIAIGRNTAGHVLATVRVCEGTFDHVEIRQMLGQGKSKVIGAFETTHPVSGDATVDLVNPHGDWKASQPLEKVSGLITASAWGADDGSGASNQATFVFDELASLPTDKVISDLGPDTSDAADGTSGPSMTLRAFKRDLCSRWER